jgi:hypothetical protein
LSASLDDFAEFYRQAAKRSLRSERRIAVDPDAPQPHALPATGVEPS